MDESLIKWLYSLSSAQPFQDTCTLPSPRIFKHPPAHLQALGWQLVTREAQLAPRSGSLRVTMVAPGFQSPLTWRFSEVLLCFLPVFHYCAHFLFLWALYYFSLWLSKSQTVTKQKGSRSSHLQTKGVKQSRSQGWSLKTGDDVVSGIL